MTEKKENEKAEIARFETRRLRYSNEVTFEFDLEVSNPEAAVAEITDFIELMAKATGDLEALRKEFAAKIEKPKETKKEGDGEADGEGSNTGK